MGSTIEIRRRHARMAVKIAVKGRPEAESFAPMPGGNPLAVLVLTNELAGRTEQDAVALAVAVLETAGPVEVVECLEPTQIDDAARPAGRPPAGGVRRRRLAAQHGAGPVAARRGRPLPGRADPAGHRQRLRPRGRHPARPGRGGEADRLRDAPDGGPGDRRLRRCRGQRDARRGRGRCRGPGEAAQALPAHRGVPDRRRCWPGSGRPGSVAGRGGRPRRWSAAGGGC